MARLGYSFLSRGWEIVQLMTPPEVSRRKEYSRQSYFRYVDTSNSWKMDLKDSLFLEQTIIIEIQPHKELSKSF